MIEVPVKSPEIFVQIVSWYDKQEVLLFGEIISEL